MQCRDSQSVSPGASTIASALINRSNFNLDPVAVCPTWRPPPHTQIGWGLGNGNALMLWLRQFHFTLIAHISRRIDDNLWTNLTLLVLICVCFCRVLLLFVPFFPLSNLLISLLVFIVIVARVSFLFLLLGKWKLIVLSLDSYCYINLIVFGDNKGRASAGPTGVCG